MIKNSEECMIHENTYETGGEEFREIGLVGRSGRLVDSSIVLL